MADQHLSCILFLKMFSKVAAFLALFAVVSAQGFGSIAVDTQNGDTVVVNQNTQRQVRIATNPIWGAGQIVEVQAAGPVELPKTVIVADNQVDAMGTQQSDILNEVLDSFNGRLGEQEYQQLLNVVAHQVATGKVNPVVLNALQTASNNEQIAQSGVQQLFQNAIAQEQVNGAFLGQSIGGQNIVGLRQALMSQAGNPLAALVSRQALAATGLQDELAKEVLISEALAESGNPMAATQAKIEAARTAQILAEIESQRQLGLGAGSPLTAMLGVGPLAQAGILNPLIRAQLAGQVYAPGFGTPSPYRNPLAQMLARSQIQQRAALTGAGLHAMPIAVY